MKKILLIEDDKDISELLSIHLADLECSVLQSYDGKTGYQLALQDTIDLIILDVMLPGMDGIEICRKLRAKEIHTPILMLTARSEEIDKVLGLETGADDYLTKPFSVREFIARVKALLRRIQLNGNAIQENVEKRLVFNDLMIEPAMRKVMLKGTRIDLTPKEYELLLLLASHPGRSYSREQLLNQVWGYEFSGYEHTVNSHINRLRTKIEPDFSKPIYILTTWGIGYRFSDSLES